MKCSACANNECEGKYENRHKCRGEKEGIECSCYCRRTKTEVFFSSVLSIGTGVAVAAAGIGLTVATGGIAAFIGGAAIAGGGTSLVVSPIQKLVTKECVTFTDSAKEIALGATIGAVTGPIGALGSAASEGAKVAVKVGARMIAGSAAGATSGVICETAKVLKGEEVSWESFGKSVAIGAVAGSIGGASTSIAHSSVCKPVADVIGRPAMRVITQAGTSMATDAGVQLATTGEIDPKLLLANTTGQIVCGTTAEAATSIASSGRQDRHQIKEPNKNDRPDRPDKPKPSDNLPDQRPGNKPDNFDKFDAGDSKQIKKVLNDKTNYNSKPEILKSHYAEDLYSPKQSEIKTELINIQKDNGNLPFDAGKNILEVPEMAKRTEIARMPDNINLNSEPKFLTIHQAKEFYGPLTPAEIREFNYIKENYGNLPIELYKKIQMYKNNLFIDEKNQHIVPETVKQETAKIPDKSNFNYEETIHKSKYVKSPEMMKLKKYQKSNEQFHKYKLFKGMQKRRTDHLPIAEKNQHKVPETVKTTSGGSAATNYWMSGLYNYPFESNESAKEEVVTENSTKNKNQKYSPEKLQCLVDLLNIHKSHEKSIINLESVETALEILRNTNDPELYGILLQYDIPLDVIGIEATRMMLEQICEAKINIEVTFNERTFIFGTNDSQNTKVVHLDLINGHFINELQDGASALYNDCLYYAIAEQLPDILDMTPDEMRRNISDVIKSNDRIRSIIINRDHTFYIDMGFFGGREAKRESDDKKDDKKKFRERISKLLKNPKGRDHCYDAINQDFPGRFDIIYEVPLEIDHVPPVSFWVQLFEKFNQMNEGERGSCQRLLRMFQILTGRDNPTELTDTKFKPFVKTNFPCIILNGLVHRNLLTTTSLLYNSMIFCNELVNSMENGKFEEAIKMIFQDHHHTTIRVREEYPKVKYPQTLSEELNILHTWQRSLIDFFLRIELIDKPEAIFLFGIIKNFPTDDYDKDYTPAVVKLMNFSNRYIKMYDERDLLYSDDEDYEEDGSTDKKDQ